MDIQALGEKFQLNQNEIAILTYIKEHRNDKNLNIRKVAKDNFLHPHQLSVCVKKWGSLDIVNYFTIWLVQLT